MEFNVHFSHSQSRRPQKLRGTLVQKDQDNKENKIIRVQPIPKITKNKTIQQSLIRK